MLEYGVASEPVPEVVGMQSTRKGFASGCAVEYRFTPKSSPSGIPLSRTRSAAFAASITLPPPMAITAAGETEARNSTIRSTVSVQGSASISEKRTTFRPAAAVAENSAQTPPASSERRPVNTVSVPSGRSGSTRESSFRQSSAKRTRSPGACNRRSSATIVVTPAGSRTPPN